APADDRPEGELPKVEREVFTGGDRDVVDEERLPAEVRPERRRRPGLAVALRRIVQRLAREELGDHRAGEAALAPARVDDQRLLRDLPVELPHQIAEAGDGERRDVDVADAAAAGRVDAAAVALDPGAAPQLALVRRRRDGERARLRIDRRARANGDLHLFAGQAEERGAVVAGDVEGLAVDGQQVLAFVRVVQRR